MKNSLPSFLNPPVVETALSIQFEPIKGFGNAHLGIFWSRHQEVFPKPSDAEPIIAQYEIFGKERNRLSTMPPRVRLGSNPAVRLQMTSADQSRMVQVQNGRLVYNWRRINDGVYPCWSSVQPDLLSYWKEFQTFVVECNLDSPKPNQWEVVYVNHFPKGRDWDSPADWTNLLPGVLGCSDRLIRGNLESLSAQWHVGLENDRGRLHIDLSHVLAVSNNDPDGEPMEILSLQLTARGPLDKGDDAVEKGLEFGHAVIVQNFTGITSETAHKQWKRQS